VSFWSVNFGVIVTVVVLELIIVSRIKLRHNKKIKLGMLDNLDDDDFVVTPDIATKLMIASLLAGTLAAMVGIGGGLVVLPILLTTGLPAL